MNNVLECSWINGRHYFRDIGDGVPKTTTKQLAEALQEQLRLRSSTGYIYIYNKFFILLFIIIISEDHHVKVYLMLKIVFLLVLLESLVEYL
jgi:hypothetical protein